MTKGVSILRPQERYNMILNLEQEELHAMANNHPDWEDLTEVSQNFVHFLMTS
jgi:hypothetical protein